MCIAAIQTCSLLLYPEQTWRMICPSCFLRLHHSNLLFMLFSLYNISSLNWIPASSPFLSCPFLVSQSIRVLPGWQCPGRHAVGARKPHRCPVARPTLLSSLLAPVWLRMVLGGWPCAGSFLPNRKSLCRTSLTTACFSCGVFLSFVKTGPRASWLPFACSWCCPKLTVLVRSDNENSGPRQCVQVCSSSLTISHWKILSKCIIHLNNHI